MFVSYLLFSCYDQTTVGEKKASSVTVLSPEFTKIIIAGGFFSTVAFVTVYVGEKVERIVAMSKPGSDEERKSLEKTEKFAFHTAKGGRDGILSWFSWFSWFSFPSIVSWIWPKSE